MSVTKSTVVTSVGSSPGTATATVALTAPAGSKAVLIWGFADLDSSAMPNASIARFNGIDGELVGKTAITAEGRAIWVYKVTDYGPEAVTGNVEFNIPVSTSKLCVAYAVSSTTDAEILIEAGLGYSGHGTIPRSVVNTAGTGTMFAALAVASIDGSGVNETNGQIILWGNTYGAGIENYAAVTERSVSGGTDGATTEAHWELTSTKVWSSIAVSVREKLYLSSFTENGGIKRAISDLNAKVTGNEDLTGDNQINGWLIGETKQLARRPIAFDTDGNTTIVDRHYATLINSVSYPVLNAELQTTYSRANVRYSILDNGTNDYTFISMGQANSGVRIALVQTNSGFGLFRSTDNITYSQVYTVGGGFTIRVGTPVAAANNPGVWIVPILGGSTLIRSTDDGLTWNVITITKNGGGTFTFNVNSYLLQSSQGCTPVVSNNAISGFVFSNASGTVWRSIDGITWDVGPVAMLTGGSQFLGFYFSASEGLVMYYYDAALSRTGFKYSTDSGFSFSQGGVFTNNGVAVSLNEAYANEVVFSKVDSDAGLWAWYKSGSVSPGSGDKVLFEHMQTATNSAVNGSVVLVTNPTRRQYVKFHGGNCISIDADFFPVSGKKLVLDTTRFTLMDVYYYSAGLIRYQFVKHSLKANLGAIIAASNPNENQDNFKTVQIAQSTTAHNVAGVVNHTMLSYYMTLNGGVGPNSAQVLPPLTSGEHTCPLYTRIS